MAKNESEPTPPVVEDEKAKRLKYIILTAIKNKDAKSALEAEKELGKYLAKPDSQDEPTDTEPVFDRDELLQAIDDHLGYLSDDVNVTYPEIIKMAKAKILELGKPKVRKKVRKKVAKKKK